VSRWGISAARLHAARFSTPFELWLYQRLHGKRHGLSVTVVGCLFEVAAIAQDFEVGLVRALATEARRYSLSRDALFVQDCSGPFSEILFFSCASSRVARRGEV
jgi:hypothetical protein